MIKRLVIVMLVLASFGFPLNAVFAQDEVFDLQNCLAPSLWSTFTEYIGDEDSVNFIHISGVSFDAPIIDPASLLWQFDASTCESIVQWSMSLPQDSLDANEIESLNLWLEQAPNQTLMWAEEFAADYAVLFPDTTESETCQFPITVVKIEIFNTNPISTVDGCLNIDMEALEEFYN